MCLHREVAAKALQRWYEAREVDLPGGVDAVARLISTVFDGVTLAWLADPVGADPEGAFMLLAHLLDKAAGAERDRRPRRLSPSRGDAVCWRLPIRLPAQGSYPNGMNSRLRRGGGFV